MKITVRLDFGKEAIKSGADLDDLREHIEMLAKKAFSKVDVPRCDYLYPKIRVERD